MRILSRISRLVTVLTVVFVAGCGGGSVSTTAVPSTAVPTTPVTATPATTTSSTFSIGGSVTGLSSGMSVTLLDNGSDSSTVSANSAFTFPTQLASGASYSVTVGNNPAGQTCAVTNGSGTVSTANVTNVAVACTAVTESVLYSFGTSNSDGHFPYGGLIMDGAGNLYGTTVNGGTNGAGAVFKITAAGTESILYSFGTGNGDGQNPYASLVMDGSGNLYGTTYNGGTNGVGTVFKITPTGAESVLHAFGAIPDGQNPYAGLIMDSSGNLYGTTYNGGTNSVGTVFKITAAGAESVLHAFGPGPDGQNPYGGLILDGSGNLYGTTSSGGTNNVGAAFKITPTGTESVLHSFGTGSDGQNPYAGLILDGSGNLYGTTYSGGTNHTGTVFKITPTGSESVLYAFGTSPDGQNPYASLILDGAGNLYGTTAIGGTNNKGTVFKITQTGSESVLYSFGASPDGQNPNAGLIMDSMGNLYGTTVSGGMYTDGTVFKIN